jgi:Cu2+-exporting ATPase
MKHIDTINDELRTTGHASRVTLCLHCQDPIPTGLDICARINSQHAVFCCHGCRAVAELIAGAGLEDYYRFRDIPANRVPDPIADEWRAYDQDTLLTQLTQLEHDGTRSTTLALDGIGCAACGWLIDRMLKREDGVCTVNMNVATARLRVRWQPSTLPFSQLLQQLARLGYRPHPLDPLAVDKHLQDEKRSALKRLAVAGLGMMQVMMFAVAMYASDLGNAAEAMDSSVRSFLRGVSLLCATPVMFYAGWPFFVKAWRAIRVRAIVMDVPVSIALMLAYGASLWNTFLNRGDVYFDSVVMFVFFLSLGRFVEMLARHRTGDVTDALARLAPITAHRVRQEGETQSVDDIAVTALSLGDEILVRSGETIPVDGVIKAGTSRIDEAMLTGESLPVTRSVGASVAAGTLNLQTPLRVRVTAIGQATVLSGIVRLLQGAEADKAPLATAADRAASWFLGRILVGAGLVAAAWIAIDPSKAFDATLAVLVVTCPCALSLATPTALAAATAALARRGVLVTKSKALESLAKITRVIFDKTGTLTHGEITIQRCEVLSGAVEPRCRSLAAALEQHAEHPIARAFDQQSDQSPATAVQVHPGDGIEGVIDGVVYRIGRREFVAALFSNSNDQQAEQSQEHDARVYLGDSKGLLAAFQLGDRLRGEALDVVRALKLQQLDTEILSGDAWVPVAHAAAQCGIETFAARQSPADKLEHVRALAARGEVVAMIGDGINDAPVLKGAAVSVAMGRASALAQVSADIVLVGNSLSALPEAVEIARKTQRIVKQNLAWAATYNLVALPLAAMGFVPPWLAAIGMSASSIVVVLNALRLAPVSRRETLRRDAGRETRDAKHEANKSAVDTQQSSVLKPVDQLTG